MIQSRMVNRSAYDQIRDKQSQYNNGERENQPDQGAEDEEGFVKNDVQPDQPPLIRQKPAVEPLYIIHIRKFPANVSISP